MPQGGKHQVGMSPPLGTSDDENEDQGSFVSNESDAPIDDDDDTLNNNTIPAEPVQKKPAHKGKGKGKVGSVKKKKANDNQEELIREPQLKTYQHDVKVKNAEQHKELIKKVGAGLLHVKMYPFKDLSTDNSLVAGYLGFSTVTLMRQFVASECKATLIAHELEQHCSF